MARELFAWSDLAEELLLLIDSYACHRTQHPELELLIYGKTATIAQIDSVRNAGDRQAAARALFVVKINEVDGCDDQAI